MNILIISPDYFDSISSLLINLITAGVSVASLFITLLMYKAAIKALSTWKEQKTYDVIEEGYANAYNAMYTAFDFIRVHPDINILDLEKQKFHNTLKEINTDLANTHLIIHTREAIFKNKKEEINEIYKIATRVIKALDHDKTDPLYIFYNDFIFHYTKTRLDIDQLLRYRHSQIVLEKKVGSVYFTGFLPDNPYFKQLDEYYTQKQIENYGNGMCEALDRINEVIAVSFSVSKPK